MESEDTIKIVSIRDVIGIFTLNKEGNSEIKVGAQLDDRLIDATGGKPTRSLIVTTSNAVIESAFSAKKIRETLKRHREAFKIIQWIEI